jgi:hypothetical protein
MQVHKEFFIAYQPRVQDTVDNWGLWQHCEPFMFWCFTDVNYAIECERKISAIHL